MKNKTGIFIILLSTLSIIGVVITQYFWIDNAMRLKKEQFDDKIHVSLKTIVNNLYSLKNTAHHNAGMHNPIQRDVFRASTQGIKPGVVDSLLNLELMNMKVDKDYYFGIYKIENSMPIIVSGNIGEYTEQILTSPFQASLACLYNYQQLYMISLYFPDQDKIIFRQMISGILLSALFVIIIGFSFIYILYISFKQKRISLIKNDFVNNMTHEFKTPISTVSLSAEMLLRDSIITDTEKARKYAKVIYEENQRLKHQVEQVLQIAVIEKGEFKLRKKEVDVHKILADTVSKHELMVINRGGVIKSYLEADLYKISADKMHFTNILSNLLENANKYTPDSPVIIVRTKNTKKGVLISIEDNGIGIKAEDQKEIFKQFHRVHTGNLHDVKGFGLGLFYVKLMTEAHGGNIKIVSEWGKGSIFEVFFPFNHDVK